MQVYIDHSAKKTLTDIQRLPTQAWKAADKKLLAPGFTHSAYWYRMSIINQAAAQCDFWLDLSTLHVTDLQMYSRQASAVEQWKIQRAGVAYLASKWASPQRALSMPVVLPAGEDTHILLRVSSSLAFSIKPQLLSEQALIKERMTAGLVDGIVLGVVGLLIAFSLLIG